MARNLGAAAAPLLLFIASLGFAPVPAAAAPPAPSCAEGPVRVGQTIRGTACDDTIVVPAGVAVVHAGPGDDTIRAAPLADSTSCPSECRLGVGSQTFDGGPGDDVVFGERGNDILEGGEGNDRLFGGIGDDLLRGGPGNDRLSGGFGADSIDGEAGDDRVRGDGTIDRVVDSGAGGNDTLSYATGVTPGFGGTVEGVPGFPGAGGERGLRFDLGSGGQNANNGIAALGGGVDEVEGASFETIVGTPFSDYIVGTATTQAIYGGGGADALFGAPNLQGGADGDNVDPGGVTARDTTKASVGLMNPADAAAAQLYLVGGSGSETIVATYSATPTPTASFTIAGGSFDTGAPATAGCVVTTSTATCGLAAAPDSVLIAAMGGNDTVTASGFPTTTSVVVLGGEGDDQLTGGEASEEVLVDGPGDGEDELSALGQDDALLHNGGPDQLLGGNGNDLFLSVSICDGETLDGGLGRDNSSWARLTGQGVTARLDEGRAGGVGGSTAPVCSGGDFDQLLSIEDLEGSEAADVFIGDDGPNQLLGHKGPDFYAALGDKDTILANSGDNDLAIDCGDGTDSALIDLRPQFDDPAPVNCETVREGEPNNFRTVTELPPPPPPPPPVDRTPPRTQIVHRPPKLLLARALPRQVGFRFAADEAAVSFECKLDGRPLRACKAPATYRVGRGRHAFRVYATDAAGNRDRSPAQFRFEVRLRRPGSAAG
jgi:Ca2+-binding RTX toxin-like protein